MSGICGIFNLNGAPVEQELLERMAQASAFRGRDGIRYWRQGPVGLAHLALHTTPESVREQQPLLSVRGDLVLAADARVDNRPELIQCLTAKGYLQEKNPTDADLILAAYECWGIDCPQQIIGDFAFVIWDQRERQLFCARDHAGVRSLFYNFSRDSFTFGTDVDQVLASGDLSYDLDGYSISDFLTLKWPEQCRSPFANVQQIIQGHSLVINKHGVSAKRYWDPADLNPLDYSQEADYIEHFYFLFSRCVTDRLRSAQNNIAIMTSGGLDSSSIAAVAQDFFSSKTVSARPIAYMLYPEHFPESDEREFCLTLSTEKELELLTFPQQLDPNLLDFSTLISNLNLPLPLPNNTPIVKAMQARNCDVLIRGDGGDELFAASKQLFVDDVITGRWQNVWPWVIANRKQGKSWGQALRVHYFWPLVPMPIQYRIARLRNSWRFGHVPRWLNLDFYQQAQSHKRLYRRWFQRRFSSSTRQSQYEHFLGSRPQIIATRTFDTIAQHFSMDARFPFLDRRLMEFMLAAPLNLGTRPGPDQTKWLLREAMRGTLPEKIRCRSYKTTGTPSATNWFCETAKNEIEHIFRDTIMFKLGIINDRMVNDTYQNFCRFPQDYRNQDNLDLALHLEIWLRSSCLPESTQIRFNGMRSWQLEQS